MHLYAIFIYMHFIKVLSQYHHTGRSCSHNLLTNGLLFVSLKTFQEERQLFPFPLRVLRNFASRCFCYCQNEALPTGCSQEDLVREKLSLEHVDHHNLPLRRDLWYHFLDFQHWSRILLAIAERQVQIPEGPANVYRGNKSVLSRGDGKISWKEGRHHHVTDELI